MIEKIPQEDKLRPLQVADKINELIDAYNKLECAYEDHYHQTGFDSKVSSGPNLR